MKLFQELSEKDYSKTSNYEMSNIIKSYGLEHKFEWCKTNEQFSKFVFYFVNCYSYESTLMDTTRYNESKELIADNFKFDIVKFITSFDQDYNNKLTDLIKYYLRIQRNRQFELLIIAVVLYEAMIDATISKINPDDGEVDFESKNNLFNYCLKLQKEILALETNLKKPIDLINKTGNQELLSVKIAPVIRPEDL